MTQLLRVALCFGLLCGVGCGAIPSDPGKLAGDLLGKQKDEMLAKLEKSLPGAEKVIEAVKKKIDEVKGDSKVSLEKILAKLQDLYKKVSDGMADLKKGGTEKLKERLADLTKNSEDLSKTVKEAEDALAK
jgi:hypothetical protein